METEPHLTFRKPTGKNDYLMTERIEEAIQEHVEASRTEERALAGLDCEDKDLPASLRTQSNLRTEAYTFLRGEDLMLGQLAIRTGHATPEQIRTALRMQEIARQKRDRLPSRLGEILVGCRVLTPTQLCALLELQASLRAREATRRQ